MEAAGARVVRVPEIGGALWLPSVMEALVEEGVTRLLVEGGPGTWRAFSDAGLIDEAVVFRARGRGGASRERHHLPQTLNDTSQPQTCSFSIIGRLAATI